MWNGKEGVTPTKVPDVILENSWCGLDLPKFLHESWVSDKCSLLPLINED